MTGHATPHGELAFFSLFVVLSGLSSYATGAHEAGTGASQIVYPCTGTRCIC